MGEACGQGRAQGCVWEMLWGAGHAGPACRGENCFRTNPGRRPQVGPGQPTALGVGAEEAGGTATCRPSSAAAPAELSAVGTGGSSGLGGFGST